MFSKTIQMYIFDGDPNGRIMCELSNWNGRVYKVARSELSEFAQRDDAENTGVYFLFGKTDNNEDAVYVGESETVLTRLKQQLNLDFDWTTCIVVISKDNYLNKAHIKYLENAFYSLLTQARGRVVIINHTIPTCSSVSEYDEAMLLEFISNTKLLINALGYKIFESDNSEAAGQNDDSTLFYIQATRGADAKGVLVSDGFTVLKGSKIATSATPGAPVYLINFRDNLLNEGIVDDKFCFTDNYTFSSPSMAASVVMGKNANGRAEWKTAERKSINDIEAECVQ